MWQQLCPITIQGGASVLRLLLRHALLLGDGGGAVFGAVAFGGRRRQERAGPLWRYPHRRAGAVQQDG